MAAAQSPGGMGSMLLPLMMPISSDVSPFRGGSALTSTWPTETLGRAEMALRGGLLRALANVTGYLRDFPRDDGGKAYEETEIALGDWMQRSGWAVRPLRIGVVTPGDWCAPLFDVAPGCDTQWLGVPGGFAVGDGRSGLDGVITPSESGGFVLTMPELRRREAAWFDWSMPRPLSFPAVFPHRTDCASLTLQTFGAADSLLIRRLIEAAVVSGRHPSRLAFCDLTRGRMPTCDVYRRGRSRGPVPYLPNHGAANATLRSVAMLLRGQDSQPASARSPSPARRAASRVAGAWLATTPAGIDDGARRECMEAAARLTGEEPETMLRLAAVRFGTLEDNAGFDAILRADRMLRDRELLSAEGHQAFIAAELEHGASSPMTVGRLAAGLCMAGASLPPAKLGHFFEDLLDDMRFANLLIGRDHDRVLLTEVCRSIEKGRRAECYSLPAAAARSKAEEKKVRRRRKAA